MIEEVISNGNLRVAKSSGSGFANIAYNGNPQVLGLNFSKIATSYYFNDKGVVVNEIPELTIIHEMIHLLGGIYEDDPEGRGNSPFYDFKGATLRLQNEIALELGYLNNIQASYAAGTQIDSSLWTGIDFGVSYTFGNQVDIVRIGKNVPVVDPDEIFVGDPSGADRFFTDARIDSSRDLIFGKGDNDLIKTGYGNDYIYGGEGNDDIDAGGDDDYVEGGDGTDLIDGGGGDDKIIGGKGDDEIDGGDGLGDTAVFTGESITMAQIDWDGGLSSPVTVNAGSLGTDTLRNVEYIESDAGTLILNVTDPVAPTAMLGVTYTAEGGLFIGNFAAMDGLTLDIGVDRAGSALDSATRGGLSFSGVGTDIIGSAGNDTITDLSDDDKTISGADGNDTIILGDGNALVFAGEGVDGVVSGAGDDIIIDVSKTAGIRGFAGSVNTGAGNDRIVVGFVDTPNRDPYSSAAIQYVIDAGAGDDSVDLDFYDGGVLYKVGGGTDTINTKLHYEYTYVVGTAPNHALICTPSITLDFSNYGESSINAVFYRSSLIKLSDDEPNRDFGDWWMQLGTLVITYEGGTITIDNVGSIIRSPPPPDGDVPPSGTVAGLIGVGYIGGGAAQTTIVDGAQRPLPPIKNATANPSAEPPLANEGDQTIILKSGTHSYTGGSGADRLIVSWDLASIAVGFDAGVLTIGDRWGKIGTTTLSNFDQIYVVADRKTYTPAEFYQTYGDFGASELLGDALANVLTAGAGTDRLFGFEGADQLYGLGGKDFLDGGTGADTMRGGTGNDIYIVDDGGDVVKEGVDAGTDTVRSSVSHTLAVNVENLELLGSALTGTGNVGANRIDGNDLDNILSGLVGNDRLVGGGGVDFLYGGDGEDYIRGGTGNDIVYGENGNDIALGEAGEDQLDGGAGNDSLVGGSGNDKLIGGDGNDMLDGGADGDILRGNAGDDSLYGEDGADSLVGGDGFDALFGDNGDDSLSGGTGIDDMSGGFGADLFRFGNGDSGNSLATADRIADFDSAQGDRIHLSAMDAIVGGADDAFAFIGDAAFGNVAGQLRYELIDGNTYVMGDTDGDGASDFMIRLDGTVVLSAADFGL